MTCAPVHAPIEWFFWGHVLPRRSAKRRKHVLAGWV